MIPIPHLAILSIWLVWRVSMGRFLSADWSAQAEPVPYAKMDNPQTLNLYAYVGNNPLRDVDADGHIAGDFAYDEFEMMEFQIKKEADAERTSHNQPVQQQIGSSSGHSIWSHVGNLFHLHSWNYGMLPSVTHSFDFHPLITAGTDLAGVIAPFAGRAENALGVTSSILSLANDHSPKNLVMTGLPFFVRELGLPLAIASTAEDAAEAGSEFITDHVLAPIFNAAPPQTIDDGNGLSMPNPWNCGIRGT